MRLPLFDGSATIEAKCGPRDAVYRPASSARRPSGACQLGGRATLAKTLTSRPITKECSRPSLEKRSGPEPAREPNISGWIA